VLVQLRRTVEGHEELRAVRVGEAGAPAFVLEVPGQVVRVFRIARDRVSVVSLGIRVRVVRLHAKAAGDRPGDGELRAVDAAAAAVGALVDQERALPGGGTGLGTRRGRLGR